MNLTQRSIDIQFCIESLVQECKELSCKIKNAKYISEEEMEKFLKNILDKNLQKAKIYYQMGNLKENDEQTIAETIIALKNQINEMRIQQKNTKVQEVVQIVDHKTIDIDIKISDKYEQMADEFKSVILKNDCRIEQLMDFYNFKVKGWLTNKNTGQFITSHLRGGLEKDWFKLWRNSNTLTCKYCYLCLKDKIDFRCHTKTYHYKSLILLKVCPYSSQKPIKGILNYPDCALGCNFNTSDKSKMRLHYIQNHEQSRLRQFQISRTYLKYLSNLINYDRMETIIHEQSEEGFYNPYIGNKRLYSKTQYDNDDRLLNFNH